MDVTTVITDAFPDRTVAAVEPLSGGHPGNRTALVRFSTRDPASAYLKVAVDGDRERIARERATTRYAGHRCHVRVPDVLAVDTRAPLPYVVTAPLSGPSVAELWAGADRDRRLALLEAVGETLARIHFATFADHGRIVGGTESGPETDLACEWGSWTDVLCTTLERRAETYFTDRFADVPARVQSILREHGECLDGAPATLVHDDLHRENCLLDGTAGVSNGARSTGTCSFEESPGVIDWETALVGDPSLDLVRAEEQYVERPDVPVADRDRFRTAIRRGYCDRRGSLPDGFRYRRPLYRVVTFLEKPRTFDRWARAAPEPTDDLADWVRSELEERIGALGEGA